jgi:hypothetical protein
MGQYGNQPDFATRVDTITELPTDNIRSAAIYIGELTDPLLLASIEVIPAGNETSVTFSGLTAGTFLPVIVTSIKSVVNIPETSILLIY